MTFLEYLKDKLIIVILNMMMMGSSYLYLRVIGNDKWSVWLLLIGWIIFGITYLIVDFIKKYFYYKKLETTLEKLDKKYLIGEVIKPSYRVESQIYQRVLKRSTKSVIEKIHELEEEQKDYKDYIEAWIHEVKLPITAIKLICTNHRDNHMRKIETSLSKLENDVDQALFYARSDTVYKDYIIKETSLTQIISSLISKNKNYFLTNGMSLEVNCGDTTVYSDSKWLEFIVNQIFINGVKYKKEGQGQIQIYAETLKSGVKLCIEDHGIGIKQSEIDRVFEKGFTGSNGRNRTQSTGIGLYLCKKLCLKLGIGIRCESKEQEYTKMILIFPKGNFLSKL